MFHGYIYLENFTEKRGVEPMKTHYCKLIVVGALMICGSVVVAATLLSGCMESGDTSKYTVHWWYSFEEEMQGWQANGTDLKDPPVNWSVTRSNEQAYEGEYSLKLYLENVNDAGKIWMERTFAVDPSALYDVTLSYKFATADFGDVNLFNLITTVRGDGFSSRDDLSYEGDTGHHTEAEGFVWLDNTFEYLVETDSKGEIYVNIGVWGSWETTRTYYVDVVNLSVEKLQGVNALPNLAGKWIVQHYNFEGTQTSRENVTIFQDADTVEFQFDVGLPQSGTIARNTLANPEHQTEFFITGIDFHGLDISVIYVLDETSMITEMPSCESCNPSVFSRA
jgi:hypothetical protein